MLEYLFETILFFSSFFEIYLMVWVSLANYASNIFTDFVIILYKYSIGIKLKFQNVESKIEQKHLGRFQKIM